MLFHAVVSSGLPPWEAPVMIAEKRKLFFFFHVVVYKIAT